MPLYIRDDDVDALAAEFQILIGARTKTEAVRQALARAMEQERGKASISVRLASAKAKAREMGPSDPAFDMKRFTDHMWDG